MSVFGTKIKLPGPDRKPTIFVLRAGLGGVGISGLHDGSSSSDGASVTPEYDKGDVNILTKYIILGKPENYAMDFLP
ncbi:MAG: hypothetical protein KAV87_63145 [Desulfobacteraceae bacterium]|nr:hypothetical protein [Desulfobacteraceae bacterium]